jgi:hypothetical protein
MPALGYTIDEASIRDELQSFGLPGFKRAYLNQWVFKPTQTDTAIPADVWGALAAPTMAPTGRVRVAVDVSPDRANASIGAAFESNGLHVVDLKMYRRADGVLWVPEALQALRARRDIGPVLIDPTGPAGALLPDLEAARIPVEYLTAGMVAQACGAFYDAVTAGPEGGIRHMNQAPLNDAVTSAKRRQLLERFAWDRKGAADISPLVAITYARHGLHVPVKRNGGWMMSV